MKIIDGWLDSVRHATARLIGGPITPSLVVLHDTAGRLDKHNSANYLQMSPRASVHFVIEVDGSITQLVPVNRRAGHAGQSTYHGRADCNRFSIGIEIVNPGKLVGTAERATSWFKESFDGTVAPLVEMHTPEHGAGVWLDYPPAQISSVIALLEGLFREVQSLTDITTHWYISPGRKIDTNPLFPLESIRARILGRDDPATLAAEDASMPIDNDFVKVVVPGSTLNIRKWPSFNPNVISAAPDGAILPVLRAGNFDGKGWLCVLFNGREGWILDRYTQPAT